MIGQRTITVGQWPWVAIERAIDPNSIARNLLVGRAPSARVDVVVGFDGSPHTVSAHHGHDDF